MCWVCAARFDSGGATASVRSCWKLPMCLMEPVPASSNTATAGQGWARSDGGSSSGITQLRREKTQPTAVQLQPTGGARRCGRNRSAGSGGGEGGTRGAPATLLQPAGQPMAGPPVPCPMEVPGGAELRDPHGAGGWLEEPWPCGKPLLEQLLAGPVAPCRRVQAGAGLLAGLVTL